MHKGVRPIGLTSLKGLKVSPFNESENSKCVKVKPLIDRNHVVEKNKCIKVNPLHNVKSCIEDEISPNTESDYMENYINICDVACQNQAFVAEMSCSVMMFLGKNVTLAFI